MQAIVFATHGGPEVLKLETLPLPQPGPGEVRVQVLACGLNHLDIWARRGLPYPIPMPHIGGCETVGLVDAVGPAEDYGAAALPPPAVGSRILVAPNGFLPSDKADPSPLDPEFYVNGVRTQGGFAEYMLCKLHDCVPLPPERSSVEWAAVPLTFITAWRMLHHHGRLRSGERVLVQAAASGVGSAAVQIAKLAGAEVIATAGSPEKCDFARRIGADHALDYSAASVADAVRRLTDGKGVDVVFEHVGAATWKDSIRSLGSGGRLVTCGATTGPKVEIDLRFFFQRELSIAGCYMGTRRELHEVLGHVAAGRLHAQVGKVYPLAEVPQAQRDMEARRVLGKLVIEVCPER